MNSSLQRRRDRRLSTGGVGTPSDKIVVGRPSKLEQSNISESNGVRTCIDNMQSSQRYLITREKEVAGK